MTHRCAVVGCNSKYNRKRSEKHVPLFTPRTEDQRQMWSKAIPNLNRELKMRDWVCELHFEEEFINRYFETRLKDGTLWQMERGRIVLRKNAVPTIFPGKSKPAEKNTEVSKNGDDGSLLKPSNLPNVMNVTIEEPFSFKVLVNSIESIRKPSEYWGITVHKCHVLCARWSHDFMLERRVIVNEDLSVQIFLRNRKINLHMDKIKSIADLSSFLEQIHLLNVCMNIDASDNIGCSLYLTNISKTKFCAYCRMQRRKERDRLRKSNERIDALQKARQKNIILCEQLRNLSRRVPRLENKIERLKKKLKGPPKSKDSAEQTNGNDLEPEKNDLDSTLSCEMSEFNDEFAIVEELSRDNELSTVLHSDA